MLSSVHKGTKKPYGKPGENINELMMKFKCKK